MALLRVKLGRERNLRIRPIVLVTFGLGWLAAVVYLIVGNVVLREIRLGAIAQFLDRLPLRIANPIFVILWGITLFGWMVPLIFGFRLLFHQQSSD